MQAAAASNDPHSPWQLNDAWRLHGVGDIELRFQDGENDIVLRVRPTAAGYKVAIGETTCLVGGILDETGAMRAEVNGVRISATVIGDGADIIILTHGRNYRLTRRDAIEAASAAITLGGKLSAPMPGKVVLVHVEDGEKVKTGQSLMVLEAMKMEHVIVAPADGVVAKVRFAAGDQVMEGDELLAMAKA